MVEVVLDPYNVSPKEYYLEQIVNTIPKNEEPKRHAMTTAPEGLKPALADMEDCYVNYVDGKFVGTLQIQMGLSNVGVRELFANPFVKTYVQYIKDTRRTSFGDSTNYRRYENSGSSFRFVHPHSKNKNGFSFATTLATDSQLSNRASQMLLSKPYLLCISMVYGALTFLDRTDLEVLPRPENLKILKDEWAYFIWQLDTQIIKAFLENVYFNHDTCTYASPLSTQAINNRQISTITMLNKFLSTRLPKDIFSYYNKENKRNGSIDTDNNPSTIENSSSTNLPYDRRVDEIILDFLKNTLHFTKPAESKSDMDWRTRQAIVSLKGEYNFTDEQAMNIWKDYCDGMGWVI